MSTEKRYLSVTQAAQRLGVNKKTVRAWADAGRIEHIKTPGGWRLFDPAELDRFEESLIQPVGKLAA